MPSKRKQTKQEEEDEWRAAALKLNQISLLESKDPAFLKPFRKKALDGGREEGLAHLVNGLYQIVCGVGSTAKLRTQFMDAKFPIPDESFTNYSRMGKKENAAGIWMGFGFDKALPGDTSWHMDAIKEDECGRMYLPLPRMAMPAPLDSDGTCHKFTGALATWFEKHLVCDADELGAVSGRLYLNANHFSLSSGEQRKRFDFLTELLKIKDQIQEMEDKRGELCELSAQMHAILKQNLVDFDVEADNDTSSDEDEDDVHVGKKQKVVGLQKIGIHTIEAPKGTGLNDPRDARRKDFKGEADVHLLELLMDLFLGDDPDFAKHRLPIAVAPHYSSGAELVCVHGKHHFQKPGEAVEGDTIMTQKWHTTHGKAQREKEMAMYVKVHDDAYEVRQLTYKLVRELRSKFSLALVFETHGEPGRYETMSVLHSPELTLLQKKALFNVFMTHIWKPTEPEEEEEGEEEGSEEVLTDEEDEEYDGEEDEDDSDEEDGEEDDSEDDEDASAGSDLGSDDD